MSNNRQSSVESLFYKMVQSFELFESKELTYQEYVKEIFQHKEKAKAMHKEEIINAWRKGDGVYGKVSKQMSVQYYNETFGGNQ